MAGSQKRYSRLLSLAGILLLVLLLQGSWNHARAGKIFPKIEKMDLTKFPHVGAYVTFYDEYGHTVREIDPEKMDISISINVVPDRLLKLKEPLSIALLLDKSGSMKDNMSHLKQAALKFVGLLDKTDKVEVMAFDRRPNILHPFSYRKSNIRNSINKLYGKGSTALYDAIHLSVERIYDQPGNRIMIVLTDGKDQIRDGSGQMSKHSLEETIRFARSAGVPIITIALGNKADIKTLKTISHYTGGQFYYAPTKYQLESLYESIAKNLTSQFKVEFTSPYPIRDGSWRKLRVQGQRGFDVGEAEKWYTVETPSTEVPSR